MEGLKEKKYLQTTVKRFDPIALILSMIGLAVVVYAVTYGGNVKTLLNIRGLLVVVGGTFASILFQYDFSSSWQSLKIIFGSLRGTPDQKVKKILRKLDKAIINGKSITELRHSDRISGEILNDVAYMHQNGLLFDEIDSFITSRIKDQYLNRKIAVALLNRAATISPALGLFGTVVGLIGVLHSLSSPGQIGPSMSLALMTTAYGAGLSSLIFTPLAGRLEHHNEIYLEVHSQLLSKVGLLLTRDERRFDVEPIRVEESA